MPIPSQPSYSASKWVWSWGARYGADRPNLESLRILVALYPVVDHGHDGGKGAGASNPKTLETNPPPGPTLELAVQSLQLIERMYIVPLAIRRLSHSSRKDGPSDIMRLSYVIRRMGYNGMDRGHASQLSGMENELAYRFVFADSKFDDNLKSVLRTSYGCRSECRHAVGMPRRRIT